MVWNENNSPFKRSKTILKVNRDIPCGVFFNLIPTPSPKQEKGADG